VSRPDQPRRAACGGPGRPLGGPHRSAPIQSRPARARRTARDHHRV